MIDQIRDFWGIQQTLEWIDGCGDRMLNTGTMRDLAAAYRELATERNRLKKIAQELYNALYYGEGKIEAIDLWEEYLK